MLDELAKGDVTKHEHILQLPMGTVAPKVAKDRVYARLEYKRQKAEEARMRSRSRR